MCIRDRDQIRVPVFAVGGLYDNFAESDLDAFAALHKRSGLNHVLIGPWPHNMSAKFAGADFGSESAVAVRSLTIDWFDHWLNGKDTRIASSAPVRIFVMGTNKWLDDREWPPERARARNFYLASQGRANTEAGDGALEDACLLYTSIPGLPLLPLYPLPLVKPNSARTAS